VFPAESVALAVNDRAPSLIGVVTWNDQLPPAAVVVPIGVEPPSKKISIVALELSFQKLLAALFAMVPASKGVL